MQMTMIILDCLVLILVIFIGFRLIRAMGRHFPMLPVKLFKYLLLYHLLFSLGYCLLATITSSDALAYYASQEFNLRFGTSFIKSITFIFSDMLHLSFLSTFWIFGLMTFFWFPIMYIAISENIVLSKRMYQLLHAILFLPGLHYWTCHIGKDGLMIVGIACFMLSLNRMSKRKKWLFLGIFLMFMIRPHICGLILLSFMLGLIFHWRYFKSKFVLTMTLVALILSPIITVNILNYLSFSVIKLSDLFKIVEYFFEFQQKWQRVNLRGGSMVDITEYPFYLKVFTFMFRPLFFDAKSALMLFSSIENTIYLLFSGLMFHRYSVDFIFRRKSLFYTTNVFFLVFIVSFMSLIITNMGLANRMKVMGLPSLIAIVFISQSHERKLSIRKKHEKNNISIAT